jgi:hypothetical protein
VSTDTFVLTSDGTTPAFALVTPPREWESDTSRPEYPITLLHLRGGRTYTGKVLLGPDSASALTLTVDASHHWGFLVVTVIVGVLAGLLVRWWADLGRPINLMQERVLRAASAFRGALAAHVSGGWPGGILETQFTAKQQAVDAQVRSLTPYIVKTQEVEGEFTAVLEEIEALEAKASALTAVTAELTALRGVRGQLAERMKDVDRPPEGDGILPDTPAALIAADRTLSGEHLALDDLDTARADAASQRAFLGGWADGVQDAVLGRAWRLRLGDPGNEREATLLKTADEQLGKGLWELWTASDATALAAPAAALAGAEEALRQVAALRVPTTLVADTEPETTTRRTRWLADTETSRGLPSSETAPLARILARRWQRDVALAVVAFLASLATTLAREYYGSPFGTFADYSTVFTWAFGLTASVSLLSSGLASLQSNSLRALVRR